MDLFNGLSDDQTALIGCAAALAVCGTIMSLSYYVGRFFQRSQHSPEPHEPQTLRMPDPLSLQSKKLGHAHSAAHAKHDPIRRAA
jgi:hypothetical protein